MMASRPTTALSATHESVPEKKPGFPLWVWFRPFIPWLLVVTVGAGMWSRVASGPSAAAPVFRTASVRRGNVIPTVSATGPLSAVSTVDVGSQVSGNIARIHVDFNTHVKAGQLIAEIEPSTYEARLAQAEGDLRAAQATLVLKRLNAERTKKLFDRQMVPTSDLDQAQAEMGQQEAIVTIKEAAVKSARVDLERTKIHSPIDGVVIDRTIDVGQTVQASFTAPTLFKVAHDLRQMQITANVSEADIGGVRAGQAVDFTVDAFPGETFQGKVREVRNNTTITNNVVTYSTIIDVGNPDLKLRPGMTANVTITLARHTDVLRVPNSALRFHPPEAAVVVTRDPDSRAAHTLYVLRDVAAPAELEAVPVRIGLSDSGFTEIVSGIEEGATVITGMPLQAGTAAASAVTNPFVPKMPPSHRAKR